MSGAIARDEWDERGSEAGNRPSDAYPSKATTIDAGEGARGARVSCAIPGRARDHRSSIVAARGVMIFFGRARFGVGHARERDARGDAPVRARLGGGGYRERADLP